MSRDTYSQGKKQREAEKAKKKRIKKERRAERREQGPAEIEIVSAADIVGNLPSSNEVMRAIEDRARAPRVSTGVQCRLFVGALSWNTTSELLRSVFSEYGRVTDAVVLTDRDTGKSRGFGFVTFDSHKDAAVAVQELDGTELDGREIVVKVATER